MLNFCFKICHFIPSKIFIITGININTAKTVKSSEEKEITFISGSNINSDTLKIFIITSHTAKAIINIIKIKSKLQNLYLEYGFLELLKFLAAPCI